MKLWIKKNYWQRARRCAKKQSAQHLAQQWFTTKKPTVARAKKETDAAQKNTQEFSTRQQEASLFIQLAVNWTPAAMIDPWWLFKLFPQPHVFQRSPSCADCSEMTDSITPLFVTAPGIELPLAAGVLMFETGGKTPCAFFSTANFSAKLGLCLNIAHSSQINASYSLR